MIITREIYFKRLLKRYPYVDNKICKKYFDKNMSLFDNHAFSIPRIIRKLIPSIGYSRILAEVEILMEYLVYIQKNFYEITYVSIRPTIRDMQCKRDECHELIMQLYKNYPLDEPYFVIRRSDIWHSEVRYNVYEERLVVSGGIKEDYPEKDDPTDYPEHDDTDDEEVRLKFQYHHQTRRRVCTRKMRILFPKKNYMTRLISKTRIKRLTSI